VLRGDFSSFDAEPDERIRIPQEAAGVINERVAKRIEMCMREGCISLAVRTVESSGIMASTPEVAIKLQEMYRAPAAGFEYDFSSELDATFVPDAALGPAPSYRGAMASTVYEVEKLWDRYSEAARHAGR
jgi:hypothetical protein